MRVVVYPADLGGCGYYRLIWPGKVLQGGGHDVKLVHPKQAQKLTGGTDENGRLVQISAPKDVDVIVFQRVSSKIIVDAIKIFRDHGIAVVIDIDDDMSAIHPSNPAWTALHPKSTTGTAEYDWESARRACEAATFVTVSTDALLRRYAPHGRGVVIRNCVPEVFTRIQHTTEARTIGWGGSMHSHPDDPQVVGTAMAKLAREGYNFKIVGPPRGTKLAFTLDDEPASTGVLSIDRYPHALGKLEVGIAPLNDTRFNAAKSWLKMLEYAALGVPCIGSPRDEYRRIHALGVGLLASNPREWYRHGKSLLDSESLRAEVAASGRAAVAQLTIEGNAWRWLEAWTKALEIQRKTGAGISPLGIRKSATTVQGTP